MRRTLAAMILISAAVILVYGQIAGHDFVNYDDPDYVSDPPIRDGITLAGIAWAFSTVHVANWIPLVWISHMADVQLFGQ